MRCPLVVLALLLTVAASGCGGDKSSNGDGLSGRIQADGSSTVGPLTSYAAERFQQEESGVQVTVGISGTGGGFERFCRGETDISNASRPIKDEEAEVCGKNGVEYVEFTVANDGIAVVLNKENDWADCLTVAQLEKIWEPGSEVSTWKQVDPAFPAEDLKLYGAGTDSGTFDFFTDQINGEEGASRSDYSATEDDNVTVQGVSGDKGALGYFGLSYYEQNVAKLKAAKIDGGSGCVEATSATVQDGTYAPLARPLLIYVKKESLARPEVEAFVQYTLDNEQEIASKALFVPLTAEQEQEALSALQDALAEVKAS